MLSARGRPARSRMRPRRASMRTVCSCWRRAVLRASARSSTCRSTRRTTTSSAHTPEQRRHPGHPGAVQRARPTAAHRVGATARYLVGPPPWRASSSLAALRLRCPAGSVPGPLRPPPAPTSPPRAGGCSMASRCRARSSMRAGVSSDARSSCARRSSLSSRACSDCNASTCRPSP